MRDQRTSTHAGAGIVADSIPENKYPKFVNNIQAVAKVRRMAEEEA